MKVKILKFLSLFVIVGFLLQGLSATVRSAEAVDATITDFKLKDAQGN